MEETHHRRTLCDTANRVMGVSVLQKVKAVGQKVDQVIRLTSYPAREALLTEMDLLKLEKWITGCMTDPANLAGAVTQTIQELFQAVIWDKVCVWLTHLQSWGSLISSFSIATSGHSGESL